MPTAKLLPCPELTKCSFSAQDKEAREGHNAFLDVFGNPLNDCYNTGDAADTSMTAIFNEKPIQHLREGDDGLVKQTPATINGLRHMDLRLRVRSPTYKHALYKTRILCLSERHVQTRTPLFGLNGTRLCRRHCDPTARFAAGSCSFLPEAVASAYTCSRIRPVTFHTDSKATIQNGAKSIATWECGTASTPFVGQLWRWIASL